MTDQEKSQIKVKLDRQTVLLLTSIISFAFYCGTKLNSIEESIKAVNKDVEAIDRTIRENKSRILTLENYVIHKNK